MSTWIVNLIKNNKIIFADKIIQPLLIIETVAKEICYSTVYLFIVTLIGFQTIIIVNIKVYMHERTSGKYFLLWFMIIIFITIITIAFIFLL